MSARLLVFGVGAVAAVCAIVGATTTWAREPDHSVIGLDGRAGWTTLIGSAVAIALAAVNLRVRWLDFVAAVPAGLAAGISAYYALYPEDFLKGASEADVGWGLVLAAIGSFLLFVSCVAIGLVPSRRATTATVV
jgi:hypothetical protein